MTFDGMMVYAISNELAEHLENGRIAKIYQPHGRDLVWHVRSKGTNHALFLSANPTYPRIHLTTEKFENPKEAPMFCMLLRKHFEGGMIAKIKQVDSERIIHIDVRTTDELGDPVCKRLVIEIMGRHSNIIAVDPQKNVILDSIHHLPPSMNQYRTVLPGRPYVQPPEQQKISPFAVDKETFAKKIRFNEGRLEEQLVRQFHGLSPLLAREIIHRAGLPKPDNVFSSFRKLMEKIEKHDYQPTIMHHSDKPAFYLFPLEHLRSERLESFANISDMLESFYHRKAERDQIKQRAQDLLRLLTNEKKKNEKKIQKLFRTLQESDKAEEYRLFGELLTAYMHLVKRGDKHVEVYNYHDPDNSLINIPLDPTLAPNENAQWYFKKYTKAKRAKTEAEKQLKKAKDEIAYLETLLVQLEQASVREVEEIRAELIEGGYVRNRAQNKKQKKQNERPAVKKYYSSEGIPILVGKNNKQNDYLTHRLASPDDTWLHTKDIPGSHVIIRGKQYSKQTLLEAAKLAAHYSKARLSSSVPVDYTLIKHVRKPNGAKPGYVIYDHHQTVFVTPEETDIQDLEKNSSKESEN